MRRFVDLHTHSTASDGSLSPAELVRLADRKRLAAVALTDHDSVDGLREAFDEAQRHPALRVIAGVELSALWPSGTMHLLALGVRRDSPAIRELADRLLDARDARNPRILDRLRSLGLLVSMDDVMARLAAPRGARPVVGRLHIAQALVAKGYARNTREAFERYIGHGCPAYVDKERLSPAEAIAMAHSAGALVALAHPSQLNCPDDAALEAALRPLLAAGIDGIEAYHSDHSPEQTRAYLGLARRFGLGVVGGSDFHGAAKPEVALGAPHVPAAGITGAFARLLA